MRQLTKNPTARSVIHGWQLLTMVATAFPPSATLEPFVLNFLATAPNFRLPEVSKDLGSRWVGGRLFEGSVRKSGSITK